MITNILQLGEIRESRINVYLTNLNFRCVKKNLARLRAFLRHAKRLGYVFRTIDTYLSDIVEEDKRGY